MLSTTNCQSVLSLKCQNWFDITLQLRRHLVPSPSALQLIVSMTLTTNTAARPCLYSLSFSLLFYARIFVRRLVAKCCWWFYSDCLRLARLHSLMLRSPLTPSLPLTTVAAFDFIATKYKTPHRYDDNDYHATLQILYQLQLETTDDQADGSASKQMCSKH